MLLFGPSTVAQSSPVLESPEFKVAHRTSPATAKRLTLEIGESHWIEASDQSEIHISRRGIIEATKNAPGRWELTGIRQGTVVFEAVDTAGSPAGAVKYVVTVQPYRPQRKYVNASSATQNSWPIWLCREDGIECDVQNGTLSGVAHSWDWYQKARSTCSKMVHCLFRVQGSEQLTNQLQAEILGRMGPDLQLIPDPDSMHWTVRTPCADKPGKSKEDLQERLEDFISAGIVTVACFGEWSPDGFVGRLYINTIEESEAHRLGFSSDLKSTVGLHGISRIHTKSDLEAFSSRRNMETIGRPVVRFLADRWVELVSGGEFQTTEKDESGKDYQSTWKQHGLKLKLKAVPINPSQVRVEIQGSLRARQHGDGRSLSLSSLDSAFDLALGQLQLVATLDLTNSEKTSDRTLGLSELPIFGVLFRILTNDKGKSQMMIWLEIDRDGGPLPDPILSDQRQQKQSS